MPEMIATPESSNVSAIGFDYVSQELWVEFRSGTYIYSEVPEFIWDQFRESGSKGSFFNANIKNVFAVRRG